MLVPICALWWTAGAASAHTEVVRVSPGEAARVDAGVDAVVVEFRTPIEDDPVVVVSGPDGESAALGTPSTVAGGTAIRQPLVTDQPLGTYVVEVDYVSDDGHAGTFSYTFTVVETGAGGTDGSGFRIHTIDLDVLRLWVHVLAATIWVGGQFVLAGLVPTLKEIGDDAPAKVARRFNTIAWWAMGVLVVTGVWNVLAIDIGDRDSAYHVTLGIKLGFVFVSAAAAVIHAGAASKRALAIGGALSAVGALGAVLFAVALGHSF